MSDRRFTDKPELDPQAVISLAADHPAMVDGRTLFPSTVVTVTQKQHRILISGENNRKIGKTVEKGRFKGYGIFCLSLEERATCPDDCSARSYCYGNGMQMARRHRIGDPDVFYDRLAAEIEQLLKGNDGVLIRLHVLGDFLSVEYVAFWKEILDEHPNVACFGYTHRRTKSRGGDDIGDAIEAVKDAYPDRFRIRWSTDVARSDGAVILDRVPRGKRGPAEELICPSQTDATSCCATCGLCWEMSAAKECIGFIKHGRHSDAALAESYKKDEEKKFHDSLVAALPKAKTFALSLCGDKTKAEDIVQEAAKRALSNRDKFSTGTNFNAWFNTIIKNHFYDQARKSGREVGDPDGVMTGNLVSAENPAERLEAADVLARLDDMPESHRDVLRDAGLGLTIAEIAEKHNIPEGTVKSRVSRARVAFNDAIEKPRILVDKSPSIDVAMVEKPNGADNRHVRPVDLPTVKPAPVNGAPMIRRVKPTDLIIEGSYQRDLSGKSMKLIKKMVSGWDWAKFKPPVCAESDSGLFVVDGQHTAIAAASHPEINEIPVMVVKRVNIADRAGAFVSQNTERVAMSPLQIFHAEVVAGKKQAFDMLKSTIRAGASIPRSIPAKGKAKPGEVVSMSGLRHVWAGGKPEHFERVVSIAVKSNKLINTTLLRGIDAALKRKIVGDYPPVPMAELDDDEIAYAVSKINIEVQAAEVSADVGCSRYDALASLIETYVWDLSEEYAAKAREARLALTG